MPGAWEWWAGVVGEESYDLACGCRSRNEAVATALREAADTHVIQIVEARSSTAAKYDGADFVPFVRVRNHEVIGTPAEISPHRNSALLGAR